MKTKLIKGALVTFHWITLAGVVAQEFWTNRYAGNVLIIGMLYWIVLGTLFCLAGLGYVLGAYTPSMISAAISLTKPLEPVWWRFTLRAVHLSVLLFALVTGHWWNATILAWVWAAGKIANLCAKFYLSEVKVDGKTAVVERLARN